MYYGKELRVCSLCSKVPHTHYITNRVLLAMKQVISTI